MNGEFFEYPVDGTLDLHMFRPGDVKSVLQEYLFECRRRGIFRVRIIHGKGQGVLRQIVRTYLERQQFVRDFSTPDDSSSWGATIAILEPLDAEDGGE